MCEQLGKNVRRAAPSKRNQYFLCHCICLTELKRESEKLLAQEADHRQISSNELICERKYSDMWLNL